MLDPTTSVTSASRYDASPSPRIPSQTLDQDDFLSLLVAQMTNQDPLNPKADLDSIAQMAQFSALEQNKTLVELNRTLGEELSALRSEQQVMQANALVGQTVVLQTNSGELATGTVSAVQIVSGTPKIVVNGMHFDLSQVTAIQAAPVAP